MISAIILAAGQSTRMGTENKLLLPFRGATLIEHMVDVVTASDAGETLVVLGHEAERVRPLLGGKPVRLVNNPDYEQGMGSSLDAGLRQASPGADGAMICLTDLPLLESGDLNRLIAAFVALEPGAGAAGEKNIVGKKIAGKNIVGKKIVVPVFRGERGNPVLFSMAYREEVLSSRGPVAGCRGIVKRYPEAVLKVEMDNDHILRDIDTPDDYRALMAVG